MSSSILTSSFKLQDDYKMSSRHHTKHRGRKESISLQPFLWNKENSSQNPPADFSTLIGQNWIIRIFLNSSWTRHMIAFRPVRPLPWNWEQGSLTLMYIVAWRKSGWRNQIMVLLKRKLEATECPLWVHIPPGCRHSTLQFKSASLSQTAISVRDMGCPRYLAFPHGLLLEDISPLSFLLPTSPLNSGISPAGTACVSLEVFATLPWKTLLMFLLSFI